MQLPLHSDCKVLKTFAGIIAVDKAAGILSHPNRREDGRQSLLSVPYDGEEEAYKDGNDCWYLLNRLDSPTSGVVLLATDAQVAKAVRLAFAEGRVQKTYMALVKGLPRRTRDIWRDHLVVERRGNALRTRPARGPVNAVTRMEVFKRGRGVPARTLLKLFPETGKTHQLRVQCAGRNLPIVGDATYGDFATNRDYRKRFGGSPLFLHSYCTRLEISIQGKKGVFEAISPLPEIFTVALK